MVSLSIEPYTFRLKSGVSQATKKFHFVFNYSGKRSMAAFCEPQGCIYIRLFELNFFEVLLTEENMKPDTVKDSKP